MIKILILGNGDIITDAKRQMQTGCGPKIAQSAHLW